MSTAGAADQKVAVQTAVVFFELHHAADRLGHVVLPQQSGHTLCEAVGERAAEDDVAAFVDVSKGRCVPGETPPVVPAALQVLQEKTDRLVIHAAALMRTGGSRPLGRARGSATLSANNDGNCANLRARLAKRLYVAGRRV